MTHLTEEEAAQVALTRQSNPFVEAAFRQLDRIIQSGRFQRCLENSRGFLELVVALKLIDRVDLIREAMIANRVFKANTRQTLDSPVRECARTLRLRLKEYYRREGRNDPIRITIPKGSYAPEILDRRRVIVICPFENWNPARDQKFLCEAITEEVAHRLGRDHRFVVKRVVALSDEQGARAGLEGSLISYGDEQVNLCCCFLNLYRPYTSIRIMRGRRDELLKLAARVADFALSELMRRPDRRPNAKASSQSRGFPRKRPVTARTSRGRQPSTADAA